MNLSRLLIPISCLVLALTAEAVPPSVGQSAEATAKREAPVKNPDATLKEAYKREFAFLLGQKRELSKRKARVERESEAELRSMKGEISRLESRLLSLGERSNSLREAMTRAAHKEESSSDDGQLVEATLDQAAATLKDYDLSFEAPKDEAGEAEALKARFKAATQLIHTLSQVDVQKGSFFKADGQKTDGDVIRIGRIAAYGVSGDSAGVLAPAGGGKLKLWVQPAPDDAKALLKGDKPELLSIFLFDNINNAVEEEVEQTVLEHVDAGGSIAWVIVGLGAIGVLLAGIRAALLMANKSNIPKLETEVGSAVAKGQLSEAISKAGAARGAPARVLKNVLETLKTGDDDVEDVVSESILKENRSLQRFGMFILVIAAVAPLLGLLGTVTGMISTFDIITKFGTGDPKMLSGGISTALITTELGLVVAIPMLLIGNLLKGWGDNIEGDMEKIVLRVVNAHKEARHQGRSED